MITKWIIPANGKMYDHAASFSKRGYIDWRQGRTKYQVGDIVYIYYTKPFGRIRFKTRVERVQMRFNQITDDAEFWFNIHEYERGKKGDYVRLVLLKQIDKSELSYENLLQHGLNGAIQGAIKVKGELASYLDRYL